MYVSWGSLYLSVVTTLDDNEVTDRFDNLSCTTGSDLGWFERYRVADLWFAFRGSVTLTVGLLVFKDAFDSLRAYAESMNLSL